MRGVCGALLVTNSEKDAVLKKRIKWEVEEDRKKDVLEDSDDIFAKEFVDRLLTEGNDLPCDETNESFTTQTHLPPYYDRNLCKLGQQFFYKHIFGHFIGKLMGLIALMSIDESTKILVLTNNSSTPLKAYRRYVATTLHMCIWYDGNFDSDSGDKLWSSLSKVRHMHNAASKKSVTHNNYRVKQSNMAFTQFGFMGFCLARPNMTGLHNASDEEWKGFVHLWRVIGYVLGMDERFNICKGTVRQTRKICELLIDRVFLPCMRQTNTDFDLLSKAMITGMWAMNPVLQYDVFLLYLNMMLENSNDPTKYRKHLPPLGRGAMFKLKYIMFTIWCLQFTAVRVFFNYLQIFGLWLIRNFPMLAYYQHGKRFACVCVE